MESKTIKGQATLTNPVTHDTHVLNEVGSFVWNYIARRRTKDQIVAAVVANYQVTSQVASVDVEAFLLELQAKGLVLATETRSPLIPLSSPWVGILSLTIIVVSIARRAEPIGGILLYYLAILPLGLFWGGLAMLPQENPYALEGDTTSYAWSLGLLIPWVMLRFVEAVIMLFGAFSEPRTWGTIRRARIVLCLQGLVSSLSVVIHGFYFPKFIIMDVTILASVAIWLSYLSRSKRVARVFGAE